MGNIPFYTSQVDARTGRENAVMSTPEAFGAGVGRAVEQLSRSVGDASQVLLRAEQQKNREEEAAKVATFDNTRGELELRQSVNENADGYQSKAIDQYTEAVDKHVESIEDNQTRKRVREKLMSQLPNVSSRAAEYEITLQAKRSTDLGNQGLTALQNKISQNPSLYDGYVEEGNAVIDALPSQTATQKEAMKRSWAYDSAKRRFDGMLNAATKPEEYDAIASELANQSGEGTDWQSRMLPADYEQVMNQLGSAKKARQSQLSSQAKATLTTLEDRQKDTTTVIPQEELQAAQVTAQESGDPEVMRRMARVMRDNEAIRTKNRLPPSELRAQINATNGNPGLAYPGLPPRVSDALNKAAQITGESVGFLGGTVMREYGGELQAAKKVKLSDKFKPQIAHDGIDIRNLRSDVVNAVTYAGEVIGEPLVITKGGTGTAGNDGIDILTLPYSDADKAKLVGALVDSGFTGFAEYDGYLRVSMRGTVPENFGQTKDGKVWGGWTNLSPEVVKTLQERGFGAGASSDIIKRNKHPELGQGIDYGKTTQITDASGAPTSSATGIMQFTKGTWLDVIKDPTTLAALNLDITNMSDDDLLAMRADPDISIVAGAIYASKNRKTLQTALGRPVNDAEIYMAHFMGAGGATAFLNAYKNTPNAAAADLLPSAAKANPNVFYEDGKNQTGKLTVAQIYGRISRDFALSPSQVAFEDNKMNKAILDNMQKQINDDPLTYAAQVGSHTIPDINEDGGWAALGTTAMAVANHYEIPASSMKPLTKDMENQIKATLDKGNADQSLQVMAGIQSMGRDMSRAALRQLQEKEPAFAQAGSLYLEGLQDVASDIMRGQQKIKENPALVDALKLKDSEIVNAGVIKYTSGALYRTPELAQATQEAAVAYFVEKYGSKGKAIDDTTFGRAVNAVLGGTENRKAIQEVNGTPTYLPLQLDADTVEKAFKRISMADLIAMSDDGSTPRYADGTKIDVDDLNGKVNLQYRGGGTYWLVYDDGSRVIGDNPKKAFVMTLEPDRIKRLAAGGR